MKPPPTALLVLVFLLLGVLAFARYAPSDQLPAALAEAQARLRALLPGTGTLGDPLRFDPPARLPDAMEGQPYLPGGQPYSFCDPPTTTSAAQCPAFGTEGRNPSGGVAPYTLKLGSGFPPQGLILGIDGQFTGTPSVGTGGRDYTWPVCAVDRQGTSVCRNVTLFVGKASGTATPRPGPVVGVGGTWVGPDTQTDTACDFAGTVRLTLTQSANAISGTATFTLNLTRDKLGGACLPTRNYTLPVSGTTDGQTLSFTIGGAWRYTGTVEGTTLRATGTVTAVGITTTDTMTTTRQ
jgi:hypothetical protein